MKPAPSRLSIRPEPLTDEILASHRFAWAHRVDIDDVSRTLSVYPGRSVWLPGAGEFAIVAPWRHRMEIGAIVNVSAVQHAQELVAAAVSQTLNLGAEAAVMAEWGETRHPDFYRRAGLDLLDEVISFEIPARGIQGPDRSPPRFEQVRLASEPLLERIIAIDHASFPWLWRNSRLEFEHYLVTPGVELWTMLDDRGDASAYIGFTQYAGWGHVDRIAVAPGRQGIGLGETAVRFAVDRMSRGGSARVGLSTQLRNERSQRLYRRLGFTRTGVNDYRIYGWIEPYVR